MHLNHRCISYDWVKLRCIHSCVGLRRLLGQRDDLGVEHPIAFFRTTLIPAQRNWATTERLAYAVPVAVNKFKHWVFGSKVTIHSDHNPLPYLTESVPKSSKLIR